MNTIIKWDMPNGKKITVGRYLKFSYVWDNKCLENG